jgi:hypothetical protein
MTTSSAPDPLLGLSDEALGAQLSRAAALPDAPAAWQQRALAAWRLPPSPKASPAPAAAWVDAAARALGAVRQLVQATLGFDSWATGSLAMGLRSTGSSTRQLVFSAEGRDVDLRIAPAGQGFTVSGQILGPDESGTAVLVPPGGDASGTRQATVDPLGEFYLSGVLPGRYELRLLLGRDELVLPAFDVGGAAPGGHGGVHGAGTGSDHAG